MNAPTAIAPQLSAPSGAEPGDRGRLQIGDVVVGKLVEHAANAVSGVLEGSRRVAGVALGQMNANATVAVGIDTVDIELNLILRYPDPIPVLVGRVREHVTSEVLRITGHTVRSFEVTVTQLRREHTARLR